MPDDNKNNEQIEALKRELERRSLDQVKVFNPTSTDQATIWNGFSHLVRAGQEAILPRYIAEKFTREMIDYLINAENDRRVRKENAKRVSSGQKEMDAQEREVFDLRTNNPELRKQFLKEVYKGVTQEYGKDIPPIARVESPNVTDADLFSEIDRQYEVAKVEAIKVTPVVTEIDKKKGDIEQKMEAK
jgi:hypothetical protein